MLKRENYHIWKLFTHKKLTQLPEKTRRGNVYCYTKQYLAVPNISLFTMVSDHFLYTLTGFTIHFWRLPHSSQAFLSNLISCGRMKDWGKKLNSFFPKRTCILDTFLHRRSFRPIWNEPGKWFNWKQKQSNEIAFDSFLATFKSNWKATSLPNSEISVRTYIAHATFKPLAGILYT